MKYPWSKSLWFLKIVYIVLFFTGLIYWVKGLEPPPRGSYVPMSLVRSSFSEISPPASVGAEFKNESTKGSSGLVSGSYKRVLTNDELAAYYEQALLSHGWHPVRTEHGPRYVFCRDRLRAVLDLSAQTPFYHFSVYFDPTTIKSCRV